MQAAGLSEILQSRDEVHTAFVPTNDAFLALEQKLNLTQSALFANKLLLTKVCLFTENHVLISQAIRLPTQHAYYGSARTKQDNLTYRLLHAAPHSGLLILLCTVPLCFSSIAKPCHRDLRTMCAGVLQLLQQHIVPGKNITQFSVSNNQQLPSLLADSPLTVSTLPSLDAR